MDYGLKAQGSSMGHNAGSGHRAVAAHIKGQHANAGNSGNSVSSQMKPTRSGKPPGKPESILKSPRRGGHHPHKPID